MRGFLDLSGDYLLVRHGHVYVPDGDMSLNGKLYGSGDASFDSLLTLGGDASLNSKLYVAGDIKF